MFMIVNALNDVFSSICILPIIIRKKLERLTYVGLIFIEEKGKRHYVLVKDFNTFLYDQALHRKRKHICCYCSEETVKSHINKCFEINGKQMIKMF